MNIVVEDIAPCRKRLKIEIPANRVAAERNEITKEFQKWAKIEGFRPGKAPLPLVEKKYGKDIDEELKRALVPKAYREAVREKNLRVVSVEGMEDLHVEPGISMSFSALVDLEPEFVLPSYKGLIVPKVDTTVEEAEIDQVASSFLEEKATYHAVEGRPIAMGDFAVVTYQATVEGVPMKERFPEAGQLAENQSTWLLVREDAFLPGVAAALVGANVGETREVEVTFPADFGQENLRGIQARYTFTLERIQEKRLPEWNDEMLAELQVPSIAELRERIRTNLQQSKESRAKGQKAAAIAEQLAKSVTFDLPESSVNEEIERVVHDIVRENQMRGIPDEMLEEKKEEIFTAAQGSAKDKVKIRFILEKIADAEKITVSQAELSEELTRMALRTNLPVKKLVERLKDNNAINLVLDDIRNRKVMDFLLEHAVEG
ncbi:MAG: trigger factor [Candidatus Methylacidiphilales bacterium]